MTNKPFELYFCRDVIDSTDDELFCLNIIKERLFDKTHWANPEDLCAMDIAIEAFKKQIPKPPIPDENATGVDGDPVPRCQVCGYALDLRMEQYCPCCGQRLTEYPETEVK